MKTGYDVHLPFQTEAQCDLGIARVTAWDRIMSKADALLAQIKAEEVAGNFDREEVTFILNRIEEAMADNAADLDIRETQAAIDDYQAAEEVR